jgi:4-alpha-glucanotransferase
LYDWPALQRRRYRWWVERVRRTLDLFDLARIDHFRGLVAYWSVPAGARTARGGSWRRGPGIALFRALERELGAEAGVPLPLVAEDLGVITEPVERLRKQLGLPGMLVIQFGMGPDDAHSVHRLANHTADRVVYTSTHDQDTARGWLESLSHRERAFVASEVARLGFTDRRRPWWGLIRYTFSSPAQIAMIQAQDALGLGSEARMNAPGSKGGSWRWQMRRGALTPALAKRLREASEESGRLAPGA